MLMVGAPRKFNPAQRVMRTVRDVSSGGFRNRFLSTGFWRPTEEKREEGSPNEKNCRTQKAGHGPPPNA
jgi:hypothetical protein